MLGRLEMDVNDCIEAYRKLTVSIFNPKHSSRLKIASNIIDRFNAKGRFDSDGLGNAMKAIIKSCGLPQDAPLLSDRDPKCKV